MSTIESRITALEQSRERHELRKNGPKSFVEEVAEMLQDIDGQADLGMGPGVNLWDLLTRRMQVAEGFDLSLMPGDTLAQKEAAVELAHYERIVVSAEARHAARGWFQLFDGL